MESERLTPAASRGSQAKALRQAAQNFKAGDLRAFHETLTVSALRERVLSVTLARHEDPECPLIGCSDAFLNLTGYTRAEVIGKNLRFLNKGCTMSAEDRHRMRIAVRTGKRFSGVLQNRRKNGDVFLNSLHMTALRIGTAVYILGIQVEVTNAVTDAEREVTNRAVAEELQVIVDSIFAANVDAWAMLQVMQHNGAKLGHVPYVETLLQPRSEPALYTKARDAFVSIEHDLLQNQFMYKNTFLEVYDGSDDTFLLGLRHVSSEPTLSTLADRQEEERHKDKPGLDVFNGARQSRTSSVSSSTMASPPLVWDGGRQVSAPADRQVEHRHGAPANEEKEEASCKGPYHAEGKAASQSAQQPQNTQAAPAANSVGSSGHPDSCRPCAFHCYSLVACNQGEACLYCHMDHPRKRRQRGRQSRRARKDTDIVVVEEEGNECDNKAPEPAPAQPTRQGLPTPGGLAPLLTALELLSPLPLPEMMSAAARASLTQPRIAALANDMVTQKEQLSLEYSECSIVLIPGQWKSVMPFVGGDAAGAKRFRVFPELPRGLILDSRTGVISGHARTPTSPDGSVHTVVMECSSGCAEAIIHAQVLD